MLAKKEPAGVLAVRADAADFGGQVDHDVGLHLPVQPLDVGLAGQVKVLDAGTMNCCRSRPGAAFPAGSCRRNHPLR